MSLVASGLLLAPRASATELQVALGPQVQGSSWRTDVAVAQSLKLGVRFADLIAIDALVRIGYGMVDQRMLTYLSLGGSLYGKLASGRLRPFGRLALVHQHEEPTSALRQDAVGALFGVGDGIRHRGGAGASLGMDAVISRARRTAWLLGADVNGTWFPDPRGPAIYFGGGLWVGLNYSL